MAPDAVERTVEREPTTASDVIPAIVFAVLVAPIAFRTARGIDVPLDVALFLLGAFLGLLATDLTSGLVHWMCDTFFSEDTPFLGRALIRPFRDHHRDPLAMTRRGLLRGNRSNFVMMSVVLAIVAVRRGIGLDQAGSPLAEAVLFSYACSVVLTNQFHKWAHAPRVPALVGWLQAARLVISPAHHAVHHRAAYGRAFCVTTGWLNPALDRAGVFRRLEGIIAAVRAVAPARSRGARIRA